MNGGIILPKKVEYVIVRRPRKRLLIASVLTLLVIAAVGAAFLVRHIGRPHKYPVQQLPLIGLKANLKTKWVNDSGHYIFDVRPIPGNENRFIAVLQTVPHDQLEFQIHLLDPDGFEVCYAVPKLHVTIGTDGKAAAMRAGETFANCTRQQLREASQWHITYRFPHLGADINRPQAASVKPDAAPDIKLTGADALTGEIETLNAGSFKILKHAEYETLVDWRASDGINLLCEGTMCVLTNLRTGESVHAAKR